MALVADKMRRAHRELARVGVRRHVPTPPAGYRGQ
jgi:hypothetical protein